ncbi:inositol monophosphatase family protein [Nocardia seriolae]|uniref:inositol monophosphatase family protein n=1 Tax=Nocardia seriolae TaxID=37332 RepID=UPI001F38BFA3|nr:inositol monophosphatase family protein [Nocardia seriolae]
MFSNIFQNINRFEKVGTVWGVDESDVVVAIRAAEAAAGVMRDQFHGPVTRYDKQDDDFATQADIGSERTILDVLRAARPGDRFLAEESGDSGGASDRTWLIDPLCGTRNFAAETPLVAVNIALRVGDRVAAAVVADPFASEIFWTVGEGAFVRREGQDHRLAPESRSRLVEIDADNPSPFTDWFSPARFMGDPAFATAFYPRVLSTSLALTWVATGRRAAYIVDRDLRDDVHFAAGTALCRAAGCVVTGLTGQPLHTPPHGLLAAADPTDHARLLEIITARR